MKSNGSKNGNGNGNGTHPTLADLIDTVTKLTHNERLAAYIVADMINTRRVSLEGMYQGRRVVVN